MMMMMMCSSGWDGMGVMYSSLSGVRCFFEVVMTARGVFVVRLVVGLLTIWLTISIPRIKGPDPQPARGFSRQAD
jgi:hypothetical protein